MLFVLLRHVDVVAQTRNNLQVDQTSGTQFVQVFVMILQVEHPFLAEGIEVFLGLGDLVIDFQERIVVVVQAIALRRMCTVRSQDNSIYAHAGISFLVGSLLISSSE